MSAPDPLTERFTRLRESGLSKDEAWKVLVLEILANAGLVVPEQLEPSQASTWKESAHIPIVEAKLLKVVRIEPSEQERVRALLKIARDEAAAARQDPPSESSVIRQALSLGLDELKRQRFRR